MYRLSAEKKWLLKRRGRCREVAIVERWPIVEVPLYEKNDLLTHVVSRKI